MGSIRLLLMPLCICLLAGCAVPRPAPGWPPGDARPINLPQVTRSPS